MTSVLFRQPWEFLIFFVLLLLLCLYLCGDSCSRLLEHNITGCFEIAESLSEQRIVFHKNLLKHEAMLFAGKKFRANGRLSRTWINYGAGTRSISNRTACCSSLER